MKITDSDKRQGAHVAALRKAAGQTQAQAAQAMGYSVRQWARLEAGIWPRTKRVREQVKERIATVLQVPLAEIQEEAAVLSAPSPGDLTIKQLRQIFATDTKAAREIQLHLENQVSILWRMLKGSRQRQSSGKENQENS